MAYTPKTWECGDTITANDLNHIEEGIANASSSGGGTAPLIVHVTERAATEEECPDGGGIGIATELDKTWQEIKDAMPNVVLHKSLTFPGGEVAMEDWLAVTRVSANPGDDFGGYYVAFEGYAFTASTANGYPSTADCIPQ